MMMMVMMMMMMVMMIILDPNSFWLNNNNTTAIPSFEEQIVKIKWNNFKNQSKFLLHLPSHPYPLEDGLRQLRDGRRVEVLNEQTKEAHFLPGVLDEDLGVRGPTPQAVRGHHHRQVAGVHLRYAGNLGHGEFLGWARKRSGVKNLVYYNYDECHFEYFILL